MADRGNGPRDWTAAAPPPGGVAAAGAGRHPGAWLCAGLLLLAAGAAAAAAEPIQLPFQQPLQAKKVSDMAVELGGYDVTHFARLEGSTIVITLATELEPGQYPASVIVYYADGEVQTLTEQLITVAPPARTSWQFNSSLNTSYRVGEQETASFAAYDHLHSNAGFQGRAASSSATVDLSAELQAVYDTNATASPTGDELALAGYKAGVGHRGGYGQLGVYAGDTAIAQESLLFSRYQRRGLSVRGQSGEAALQGMLFSVVSDLTTSARDDLLTPDDGDRGTVGGSVTLRPLPTHRERLILGFGYVDGEGSAAGSGFTTSAPETVYGGRSWNATADSTWLDRSLWLHLEWAGSNFDSDGIGVGDPARADDAAKLLLQLNSNGDLPGLGLDHWSLTLQQQHVGALFYSIANLALPGDLDSSRLSLNGTKGGLSFLAEWAAQQNNEADDPDRATLSIDYRGLDLGYTPLVDRSRGLWAVLGAPSFNAYVHATDTSQETGDALLTGVDVDSRNREYALGATFTRERVGWSLSHALTRVDDRSEAVFQNGFQTYAPLPDSDQRLTVLQVSWFPHARLTLAPFLQWSDYEEPATGNRLATYNTGIEGRFHLLPNKLLLDVNYSLGRNDYAYGDPAFQDAEAKSHSGNFRLAWKAVAAKNHLPGADLYLNGSYGRQQSGVAGGDVESWQVRLGLSIYWAAASPGQEAP